MELVLTPQGGLELVLTTSGRKIRIVFSNYGFRISIDHLREKD